MKFRYWKGDTTGLYHVYQISGWFSADIWLGCVHTLEEAKDLAKKWKENEHDQRKEGYFEL